MNCFVTRFVISLLARPKVFIHVLAWGVYSPTAVGTELHFFKGSSTQLERSPDPIFCVGPACFLTVVVIVTHTPSLGALPLSVVFLSSFLFFFFGGRVGSKQRLCICFPSQARPASKLSCVLCMLLAKQIA